MALFFGYLVGIVVVVYALVTIFGLVWALAVFVLLAAVALLLKDNALGYLASGLLAAIAGTAVLMDFTNTQAPFQFVAAAVFLVVFAAIVVWCAYFAADETHAQRASRESR